MKLIDSYTLAPYEVLNVSLLVDLVKLNKPDTIYAGKICYQRLQKLLKRMSIKGVSINESNKVDSKSIDFIKL